MKTGTVKWFSAEKGYGFISIQEGEDIFVHHTDILIDGYRTLGEGQEVQFEIVKDVKGTKAVKVQPK